MQRSLKQGHEMCGSLVFVTATITATVVFINPVQVVRYSDVTGLCVVSALAQ
jgi:hypothetical protein